MRLLLTLCLIVGCRSSTPPAEPSALDPIATRYVILALGLGRHDPNYVDAYYGPDSLRTAAAAESLTVAGVLAQTDSLVRVLGDSVPSYSDSVVRLRHRYLRTQVGSMAARARMLAGQRLSFDEEAKALYDVTPPRFDDAHFDSLLARLDSLLPGSGQQRVEVSVVEARRGDIVQRLRLL